MVGADFDTSVPALLLTIGAHEWDYGALATVRTLGRVGVPVWATVARPRLPLASSRYLAGAIPWPTAGAESAAALIAAIDGMLQQIGRPTVAIAGDDETAVLLAAHREHFSTLMLPKVAPDLPARLASKGGLAELCAAHGTPTPRTAVPTSWAEVAQFTSVAQFPCVVKNPEPFSRLVTPAVAATTKVANLSELESALSNWQPGEPLLIQEFVPEEDSEDWYVEAVFDDAGAPVVAFSGQKLRAYPVGTGVGTLSVSTVNRRVLDVACDFAGKIGYSGACDMDWRYDRRDDTYKLIDFNPRRGAQFRLFQSDTGIDVVRALHLQLTGRPVPAGRQVAGVHHVVGVLDQKAYRDQRRAGRAGPRLLQRGRVERSWWAADDPAPAWRFATQLGPAAKVADALRAPFRRNKSSGTGVGDSA